MSGARAGGLQPGLIFSIARQAGVRIPDAGAKRAIRCPFHEDRHPSAFLSERNVFYCSVCTPAAGWTAKRFAEALRTSGGLASGQPAGVASFTAQDAELVWRLGRLRALDDARVSADRDVYAYLAARHLMESWELRLFGVLASGMQLPEAVAWWPDASYRIVAPVYDQRGRLANVQARSITRREPKVLFPKGSIARQTLFADGRGLAVLRGWDRPDKRILFGEGLTDFLGLSIVSPVPVLAVPGTGNAAPSIGPWARDASVFLALDNDPAGEEVVRAAAAAAYRNGAKRVARITWPKHSKDACEALERVGEDAFTTFIEGCVSHG